MAELTLEQKRALALANARKRQAEASGGAKAADAEGSGVLDYLNTAADLANRANPATYIGTSLAKSLIKDATSEEKADARDNTMGKVDSVVRGAADTLSFGMADEIAGLGNTLIENPGDISIGFDTSRGPYIEGKTLDKKIAKERATDKADAKNRFEQRLTGQLTGGAVQGAGLIRAGLSPTAKAITAGKSLPKVMGYSAVEGGTLSALQGLGSGDGLDDRISKGLTSGFVGSVLGGALPAVGTLAEKAINPVAAYLNPDRAKDKIMAALMERSGLTPDDLAARLQGAQDDAQGMFTAADAMELPAQRIISTTARTPNEQRKPIVDALLGRQMDQGRRVAASLTDASGSTLTAEQYQQLLRSRRAEDAARNYAPVMEDASTINVTPVIAEANRRISPTAEVRAVARGDVPTDLASRADIEASEASIRDPIRQALKEARSYLASDNLTVTNVEKAFRAKTNIDQMINKAAENNQGGMVEALMPIQQQLDEALARTSRQYASARDAYRTASQRVDAVDTGRQLARGRNRAEDTLNAFGALPDEEAQQAARVGYFDPKIAQAETTKGKMPDVARQFTSDSMRRELPELAYPGTGDQLMRRLARENTMTDTAQIALGGSKTADNLADAADTSIDPGILASLARGSFKDAAITALTKAANSAKGLNPSVLEKLAPALMETNPEVARALFSDSAQIKSISDATRAKIIAALIGSGSSLPARATP